MSNNHEKLNDILDDLCTRFLINAPQATLNDIVRLIFEMELAHWFYQDFYRCEDPSLPDWKLMQFLRNMFERYPVLPRPANMKYGEMFKLWQKYKRSVPTYGGILLDPTLQFVLLVQGWHGCSWGFPKGKVNEEEEPIDCAIREVIEETGYNIKHQIDRKSFHNHNFNEQENRLYFVPGVPMNYQFKPECKQEIRQFKWWKITNLPETKQDIRNKMRAEQHETGKKEKPNMFMVYPYVRAIKHYVRSKLRQMQKAEKEERIDRVMSILNIGNLNSIGGDSNSRLPPAWRDFHDRGFDRKRLFEGVFPNHHANAVAL